MNILRNSIRTAIALGVGSAITLGFSAGIVLAQTATPMVTPTVAAATATSTPAAQTRQALFGTITTKTGTSFSIKTNSGECVTLTVNGNTQFRAPGDALPASVPWPWATEWPC